MSRMIKTTVFCLFAGSLMANNLTISNIVVAARDNKTAYVTFDLSWENSWRKGSESDPLYWHDAAWVFFKVQPEGSDTWQHARLGASGINPDDFTTGIGTGIELVVPEDRMGMFIRRSAEGSGTTMVTNIQAVWNFKEAGIAKQKKVKMRVLGVEMVYVAEGPFYVGDGASDYGQFCEGGYEEEVKPFYIDTPGTITIGNNQGELWGTSTSGHSDIGSAGELPAEFPKGYNAFYCMKYEFTQGNYVDFINFLTRVQQELHSNGLVEGNYLSDIAGGSSTVVRRNTVKVESDPGGTEPQVFSTVTPDRACTFFSWGALTAFADWSGLRPMTELEFEKACRGPLDPVPGEFAWGTPDYERVGTLTGTDGSGSEYYKIGNQNFSTLGGPNGPVRAGAFAFPGATREESGASYWGIMELSGNVQERTVTVGNSDGRQFTGLHGNGVLAAEGDADVPNWPASDARGAGWRGSSWGYSVLEGPTSCRGKANVRGAGFEYSSGGRVVRSAP